MYMRLPTTLIAITEHARIGTVTETQSNDNTGIPRRQKDSPSTPTIFAACLPAVPDTLSLSPQEAYRIKNDQYNDPIMRL
jgi:hypothetical protein